MTTVRDILVKPHSLSVAAVIGVVLLDLLLSTHTHLAFEGLLIPVGVAIAMLSISLIYSSIRPRPGIPEFAAYAALWITFSAAACILTYFAAAMSFPFMDLQFISLDRAAGFDWAAWVNWTHSNPILAEILRIAYFSLMVQIVGSSAIFAFLGRKNRNEELLLSAAIALIITCLLFGLLPALGPWAQFGSEYLRASETVKIAHVTAMRLGGAHSFKLLGMTGIVCFPSYHTVLALLFIYAHRGIPWIFPPVLALNSVMLLSIPSEGGHYLADVWGGALVALSAILIARHVMKVRDRTTRTVIRQEREVPAAA